LKFNKRQVETAIEVVAQSKMVQNWIKGELSSMGILPDSPEGKKFLEQKAREMAYKIIR